MANSRSKKSDARYFGPPCSQCPLLDFVEEEHMRLVCSFYDPSSDHCELARSKWCEAYDDAAGLVGRLSSVREIYADLVSEMAVLRLVASVAGPVNDGGARKKLTDTRKMILQLLKQVGASSGQSDAVLRIAGKKVPAAREDLLRETRFDE